MIAFKFRCMAVVLLFSFTLPVFAEDAAAFSALQSPSINFMETGQDDFRGFTGFAKTDEFKLPVYFPASVIQNPMDIGNGTIKPTPYLTKSGSNRGSGLSSILFYIGGGTLAFFGLMMLGLNWTLDGTDESLNRAGVILLVPGALMIGIGLVLPND